MEDKDVKEFINKMMSDSVTVPKTVDIKRIIEESKKIVNTIPSNGFVMEMERK